MGDHDRETQKDEAQSAPPQKAKTGGEHEHARKHADGHTTARPDILHDERAAHPANAEPLAGLLSQLQHSHGNAYVQRMVNESGGEKASAQKPTGESHAQALDAGTKSRMESALGEDFGDVRVHTGKPAGEVTEELGALAFTHGRDIYFKEGEYNPSTREGQELLAHELTHIVQQRGGSSTRGASVGPVGDKFEQEADEVAASVMRGERAHVEQRSAASDVQRQQQKGPPQPTIKDWPPVLLEPNKTLQQPFPDFSVQVHYAKVEGANFETLHVTVPYGVSVTVVDLSGMNVQVQDPGGSAARVIVIRVGKKAQGRMLQITFSKGSRVDIATYALPTLSPAEVVTAGASKDLGRPKVTIER